MATMKCTGPGYSTVSSRPDDWGEGVRGDGDASRSTSIPVESAPLTTDCRGSPCSEGKGEAGNRLGRRGEGWERAPTTADGSLVAL